MKIIGWHIVEKLYDRHTEQAVLECGHRVDIVDIDDEKQNRPIEWLCVTCERKNG